MALREDECFLVRRFAAGGIDKNIGGSRVGGKNRFSICRVAARGSNGVYSDYRDLKIKRLHEQVQDLEVSSTWKETKPKEPVRDELTGDEEHPTNYYIIYGSLPVFDEYRDEDWYSWFTGGDRNLPGDELGVKSRRADGSIYVSNECLYEKMIGGSMACGGIRSQPVVSLFMPDDPCQKESDLIKYSNGITDIIMGTKKGISFIMGGEISLIRDKDPLHIKDVSMASMHTPTTCVPSKSTALNDGQIFVLTNVRIQEKTNDKLSSRMGLHFNLGIASGEENSGHLHARTSTLRAAKHGGPTIFVSQVRLNFIGPTIYYKLMTQVNTIQSNVPFNPGGTSFALGEMICEIELFGRVMIITIQSWVDVPFDPGGFGPKAKLEDEFF